MIKPFLFSLFLLQSLVPNAQQSKQVQLYAYEQQVIPGAQKAKNRDGEDNGGLANNPGKKYNYFFYAVPASALRLYPVELWVKGKKYGVQLKAVSSPVTITNGHVPGNPKTSVLVPKTGNKVLQLIPTDVVAEKNYPTAEKLAAQNDVVFVFKQGGKFYYQAKPELLQLDAAALQ